MVKNAGTIGRSTEDNSRRPNIEDEKEESKNDREHETILNDIWNELRQASSGEYRYLSRDTAEDHFRQAQKAHSPRAHYEEVTRPFMERQRKFRETFDTRTKELQEHGVPEGFQILYPEQFWAMRHVDRKNYLKKADDILKLPRNFTVRWQRIADRVREFTNVTFYELGAASEKETQNLLDGLKFKPKDEKELQGWESYVDGRMQQQMHAARSLYFDQLMDPLINELGRKTISERTIKELREKFRDSSTDFKTKEKYVQQNLPERIKEWRAVKAQRDRLRDTLLVDPAMRKMVGARVKDLAVLMEEDAFVALKYPRRKGLANEVESIIRASKLDMLSLHKQYRGELESYAGDGRMHPSKVGNWLNRIFTKNATIEGVRTYMDLVVRPNAKRWQKARWDLDIINQKMNDKGIPRGLHRLTLNEFLLREYDQRIAYLDEANSRINSNVNEPGRLAGLRLDIRHAMDTYDWEYAEELLYEAKKIDPYDKAVQSMERYFETHRPKEEKKEHDSQEATEALLTVRDIMSKLHPNMRWMTEKALLDPNPNTLKRLWQEFYNRHWVVLHGYSDPLTDQQEGESEWNQEQTENRIANGHDWTPERNIIKGGTANRSGIRDHCVKYQVIHTDKSGLRETYESVRINADNPQHGFWTSIVDEDVPHEQLRESVINLMYPLKKNASILRKAGLMYSSHGSPTFMN